MSLFYTISVKKISTTVGTVGFSIVLHLLLIQKTERSGGRCLASLKLPLVKSRGRLHWKCENNGGEMH